MIEGLPNGYLPEEKVAEQFCGIAHDQNPHSPYRIYFRLENLPDVYNHVLAFRDGIEATVEEIFIKGDAQKRNEFVTTVQQKNGEAFARNSSVLFEAVQTPFSDVEAKEHYTNPDSPDPDARKLEYEVILYRRPPQLPLAG